MSKGRKVKRDYHGIKTPEQGLAAARKVEHGITDNPNLPEETWSPNAAKPAELSAQLARLETACVAASDRGISAVATAKAEWGRTIIMMDEIALHVEAVGVRNPNALQTSGFTLTKERKNYSKNNKTEVSLTVAVDFRVVNTGELGKAICSAGEVEGAFNHEIQATRQTPSQESFWIHKGIFPDPARMEVENLDAGETFFRMRSHGPNGPGPFSAIVMTLIT